MRVYDFADFVASREDFLQFLSSTITWKFHHRY